MALKNGLLKQAKQEKEFEERQEHMREKYHIADNEKIIVEKNNMIKFLIKTLAMMFRILCWIVLIILATIGLMALLLPDTRNVLIQNFNAIFAEITNLINLKLSYIDFIA